MSSDSSTAAAPFPHPEPSLEPSDARHARAGGWSDWSAGPVLSPRGVSRRCAGAGWSMVADADPDPGRARSLRTRLRDRSTASDESLALRRNRHSTLPAAGAAEASLAGPGQAIDSAVVPAKPGLYAIYAAAEIWQRARARHPAGRPAAVRRQGGGQPRGARSAPAFHRRAHRIIHPPAVGRGPPARQHGLPGHSPKSAEARLLLELRPLPRTTTSG